MTVKSHRRLSRGEGLEICNHTGSYLQNFSERKGEREGEGFIGVGEDTEIYGDKRLLRFYTHSNRDGRGSQKSEEIV